MKQVTIKNYRQAADYLNFKTDRPYANNTRISLEDKLIVVRLHGNPIVTFSPGRIMLNNCGWQTMTTKERIIRFLPSGFSLYQDKKKWFIHNRKTGNTWKFVNGMVITDDDCILGAEKVEK